MPLNVRRFYSSLLLIVSGIVVSVNAQTVPPQTTTASAQPSPAPQVKTPTAGEIMRERISKAKAFIAVRNYNAAIYELESIKRESNDASVQSVAGVLLMNSYLEQGDYKRAQDFLNQAYNVQKTNSANAATNYFAVASQVVKGARSRVKRYRAVGLNVSDRTLPLEAINDLEKMREPLEVVVTQSKEISKDKMKSSDAMALLEEASTSRSMMARDDYDARKWQEEVADAREDLANSHSVVLSAITENPVGTTSNSTAANTTSQPLPTITDTSFKQPAPVINKPLDQTNKTPETVAAMSKNAVTQSVKEEARKDTAPQYVPLSEPDRTGSVGSQPVTQTSNQNTPQSTAAKETPKESGPMEVGSLLGFATKQTPPVYPPAARTMRTTGVVRVEVTVDENGNVAEVQNATGPSLLQGAAKDAIRKWRFKPFVKDGQPVRAVGYVSFNFAL